MLADTVKKTVTTQFASLENKVRLVVFTQAMECDYCKQTRELVEELAGLSDKLSVEVYDFEKDKETVVSFGIDKIPATVVAGAKDYGIRFYGIPSGYEFASLLETIKLVSTGNDKLSDATKKYLDGLVKKVHLKVFVTPTCPYCPQSVIKANQLAYYSDKVSAEMIEILEFPHLGVKYGVQGVPRTVINETAFIEGAAPEATVIGKIREIAGG